MLNEDMIKECLNEFNRNTPYLKDNEKAELKETDVHCFAVHALHFTYLFRWNGKAFSGNKDYVEDELERLFKAKLNSLDNSKIESPNHYILPSGKQLIELLQSDLLTRKEFIGFCKGNVYLLLQPAIPPFSSIAPIRLRSLMRTAPRFVISSILICV